MFGTLRERFTDIDFVDCYMNPTLRKSGLTPDQIMRRQLYALLKPCSINPKSAAIIGNDLPTDNNSDLIKILEAYGIKIHEITSCKTYAEYQQMAESSIYISYYPAAKAGGEELAKRLGGKHLYLPYSWDYEEIDETLKTLKAVCEDMAKGTENEADDIDMFCAQKKAECEKAFKETYEIIGDTPIAIDYTFCPRPTSVAKQLLTHGFNVKRIYLDSFTGEEKGDYEFLKENYPDLELYATVNVMSRFMAHEADTEEKWLAIGQKAAYFLNTDHFVNVVEGGGMFGYEAVTDGLKLMREAFSEKKEMRKLVQIKGMGCGSCGLG